ncbi:MAG TPA: hypothetical protein DCW68_03965 [Rhodospirillaceae bacterium]|nr:MAG: hypothetical protein A2018_07150 [Alphaproteobacteria bacterium GWF2_58_20]HAU29251.1 hypothetical protein [Rhodospirillaceae bacterium]
MQTDRQTCYVFSIPTFFQGNTMKRALPIALLCLILLGACGRKPSEPLPPPGTPSSAYPLTYPMEP